MFVEQQISILEWFLKDHVTLKTEKSALCHGNKYKQILKYIKIKKLNSNNVSQYFYCIYDQINAALVSIKDIF